MNNTNDLARFGFREYGLAAKLLEALAENNFASDDDELGSGIKLEFNPGSGEVFLVDEDLNVAMLNDNNRLERWNNCFNCGAEGLRSELTLNDDGECKECAKANA